MRNLQSSKPTLQSALVNVVRDVEGLIEVSGFLDLVVGFVDGVEEIGDYNEHVDALAVASEAWGARSGFGIAGADEDGVEDCLEVACYYLSD